MLQSTVPFFNRFLILVELLVQHSDAFAQVISDCLAVVGSILAEHPPMMVALSKNTSAREFVVSTLARNPAPRVRRQMGQLLVGARPMAGTLLKWLTGELEVSSPLFLFIRSWVGSSIAFDSKC